MIYFVAEAAEAYERLGVTGPAGYFASRSAPMGAVSAPVAVATFFNFNPELVRSALPGTWEMATPEAMVAARLQAVDASMRRLLGPDVLDSAPMARAAELARRAALEAGTRIEGRPLAAGHAGLDWPEEPHLVLWHAQSVLREYRGDGHVASLVTHGLSGIDALVSHAVADDIPSGLLRSTRGWTPEQWDEAVDSMRERRWISGGDVVALTEEGRLRRQEIEDQTDALAAAPYAVLGDDGCAELRSLVRPWSRVFSEVLFR
jgi:uncharacterized membrane protein